MTNMEYAIIILTLAVIGLIICIAFLHRKLSERINTIADETRDNRAKIINTLSRTNVLNNRMDETDDKLRGVKTNCATLGSLSDALTDLKSDIYSELAVTKARINATSNLFEEVKNLENDISCLFNKVGHLVETQAECDNRILEDEDQITNVDNDVNNLIDRIKEIDKDLEITVSHEYEIKERVKELDKFTNDSLKALCDTGERHSEEIANLQEEVYSSQLATDALYRQIKKLSRRLKKCTTNR